MNDNNIQLIPIANGWLLVLPENPKEMLDIPIQALADAMKNLNFDQELKELLKNSEPQINVKPTPQPIHISNNIHYFKELKELFAFLELFS